MENDVILDIRGLSRNFGKVEALNDVSVTLKRGEILCICGENGAGKSTLIKILSGAETPSSGTIIYEGEEIRFQSPDHAHRMGISTVYQEMVQIPEMSIAENIYLRGGRRIDVCLISLLLLVLGKTTMNFTHLW